MKTIKRLFTIVCVLFFTCNLCWGQQEILGKEPSDRITDVHWSFKDSVISVTFHFEDDMENIESVSLAYRYCDYDYHTIGTYYNTYRELYTWPMNYFTDITFDADTIGKFITMSSKIINWPSDLIYSETIVEGRVNFFFFYRTLDTETEPNDYYVGSTFTVEKTDYGKLAGCFDIQSNQLEYKYCLLSGIWVENQPQEGPYIQYTFSNNKMIKCEKFMNLK
ncbi:MAG: hypothetical protein MJZ34_06530 [Paludibacteraceae bacterium]|nr:hypothetical protein [Paludibacteraceae bacterium]